MKPIKGYRNVTNLVLQPKCEWPGCIRDSDIPLTLDEESMQWLDWYCVEHAMQKLKEERDAEHQSDV